MDSEVNGSVDENPDNDLEFAIDFAVRGRYPPGLSRDKKRALRRRATTLWVDKGEVLLKRKGREVKVVTSLDEQRRILNHVTRIQPRGTSEPPRHGLERQSVFTGVGSRAKQRRW